MDQRLNVAMLILRVAFGLMLFAHGYNKFFGGGRLPGTARWFASMGMKWPKWQARVAATTEVGAGILLTLGLATPLAAAGFIGVMVVAIATHVDVGFFIFRPGQGWEYAAMIAVTAFCIATIGAGKYSIDHLLDKDVTNWSGAIIAGVLGVGGGLLQLAVSYRKPIKE